MFSTHIKLFLIVLLFRVTITAFLRHNISLNHPLKWADSFLFVRQTLPFTPSFLKYPTLKVHNHAETIPSLILLPLIYRFNKIMYRKDGSMRQ